jgi:hypothetical protein
MIDMATITTTELAEEIGTSPRTLRKFLRADARAADKGDSLPGKGGRYAIERKAVPGLKKRYAKWAAAEAEARAERAAKAAQEAQDAASDETEGDELEVEGDTPEGD